MSKLGSLKDKNLDRLKDFLHSGSLQVSSKKFKVGVAAFRESIVDTAQSLIIEMNNGEDKFIGNSNHTRDIYANRGLILCLIERFELGFIKSKEQKIGQLSKHEFKTLMFECFNDFFRKK